MTSAPENIDSDSALIISSKCEKLCQEMHADEECFRVSAFLTDPSSTSNPSWLTHEWKFVLDSGATAHFKRGTDGCFDVKKLPSPVPVKMGTSVTHATHTGLSPIVFKDAFDDSVGLVTLVEFYCVPTFFHDLVLISEGLFIGAGLRPCIGKPSKYMPPYVYLSKPCITADPINYRELKGQSPLFLMSKAKNGLTMIKSTRIPEFKDLIDFRTGKHLFVKHRDIKSKPGTVMKALKEKCDPIRKAKYTASAFDLCDQQDDQSHVSDMLEMYAALDTVDDAPTLPRFDAEDRPPPEPPPNSSALRVCLIGGGLYTEVFNPSFRDIPMKIVIVIEVGENFDRARSIFKDALVLYDLDRVNERISTGELSLPEFDLAVFTLPCQDETSLKVLNNYPETKTAHLFKQSQFKFVDLAKPDRVLNEMVPPRTNHHATHDSVSEHYKNRGYNVAVDNVDACFVGDRTSHFRWFLYASRFHIFSFDVIKDSGMECTPRAASEVLEPDSQVSPNLLRVCPYSERNVFVPQLVSYLFKAWHQPNYSPSLVSPSENAYASVLLAWYFGKRPHCKFVLLGSDGSNFHMLQDPVFQYMFVLATNAFPNRCQFCVSFNCRPMLAELDDQLGYCKLGFGSPLKSRRKVEFRIYPLNSAGTVASAVDHVNSIYADSIVASNRILESGGRCWKYADPNNKIRSQVYATVSHTHSYLDDVKAKGTIVSLPTGPVSTITSDFNNLIECPHRNGKFCCRYMTIRDAAKLKSFDDETIKYLESIEFLEACIKIANAVPGSLLCAVYKTVYRNYVVDNLPSEAATLMDPEAGDEEFTKILLERAHCIQIDQEEQAHGVMEVDPHISPKRQAPKAPKAEWRVLPDPRTRAYADLKLKVDRYHKIRHRTGEQFEADILAMPKLGFVPGDSRVMGPCDTCEKNKGHIPISHHSKRQHTYASVYGPCKVFAIDICYARVLSRYGKYRYFLICCDPNSDLIIDLPLRDLTTDTFISAVHSLHTQVKLEYGHEIELLLCDFFSSFRESSKLKRLKLQLNINIELMAPYLHQYNIAENAIKRMRHASVIHLQALKGKFAGGKELIPEEYFPESFRHQSETHNQSSSAVILRKTGRKTTPRLHASSGTLPDLPLHVFGEEVNYVDPNHHKDHLRGISCLYLHSANFHYDLTPNARSSMNSVLMMIPNGKRVVSRDFRVVALAPRNVEYEIQQLRGVAISKFGPPAVIADDPIVEEVKREDVSTPPSAPKAEPPELQPIRNVTINVESKSRKIGKVGAIEPSSISTLMPVKEKLLSYDEQMGESDTTKFLNSFRSPGPMSHLKQGTQPSDISDINDTPLTNRPTFTPRPIDRKLEPSTSVPLSMEPLPLTEKSQPTPAKVNRRVSFREDFERPTSQVESTPLSYPDLPVPLPAFRKPVVGDKISIIHNDGTWSEPWTRVASTRQLGPEKIMSETTPGKQVKKSDTILIERDDVVKTYDVRQHRFDRPGNTGTWKYATWTDASHGSGSSNTPIYSCLEREFARSGKLVTARDKLALGNQIITTKFERVPGFKCYRLKQYNDPFKSYNMFNMLMVLTTLSCARIFGVSEFDTTPKRSQQFTRKRTLVNDHMINLDKESLRVLNSTSSVQSYLSLGGSQESLRKEIQSKHIQLNDSLSMYKDLCRTVDQGESFYTYSTVFDECDLSLHRAQAVVFKAQSAQMLWDSPLVGLYDTIGRHLDTVTKSSPPLEHLYCGYFRQKEEDDLETVLSCCPTGDHQVEVVLQLTCVSHILEEKDLEYAPETIVELKNESLEDKVEFLKAIMAEFNGLCRNECFSLEVVPEGRSEISTRIVLKIKRKANGELDKYKARCVVRGFLARIGLDYYATYCPMASLSTSRLIIALGCHHGTKIHHADIPQAFIQSELDRDIFINLPKGISVRADLLHRMRERHPRSRIGIRLLRSLYGLKQAPMLFNKLLNKVMLEIGFERSKSDTCLYVSKNDGKWCACAAFVDDILITGTDQAMIAKVKEAFKTKFKGSGAWDESINSFLGIDIHDSGTEIRMNIKAKIDELFSKFSYLEKSRWSDAPYAAIFENPPADDDALDEYEELLKKDFQSIVGSCIYFSITCRPDIATIVNRACKGMHSPKKIHIQYLSALVKYLQKHRDTCLTYTRAGRITPLLQSLSEKYIELQGLSSKSIVGFSDANHLDKIIDGNMKSTSGNCFFCFGNLVSWHSKKQTITASSSMQSELIAASTAADQAVWFHTLMSNFPTLFKHDASQPIPPVPLLIDNKAALSVANHPDNSARTRHIALREFRIRDFVEAGQVRPFWCPGSHNLADHFTKPLQKGIFGRLNYWIGMNGIWSADNLPALVSLDDKPDCEYGYEFEFVEGEWKKFHCFDSESARSDYCYFKAHKQFPSYLVSATAIWEDHI